MTRTTEVKENVVIKFAGDSGDGMQLVGNLFTGNTALTGADLATFPDFPAEIRAPVGTLAGVSGFQLRFGSNPILSPGDHYDVLVAMNAAALKVNLERLRKGGTIIANTDGFDKKNLRLAGFEEDANPLEDESLKGFELHTIPITKLTREALADSSLGTKQKDQVKNMFVLGFLYWRFNRNMESTIHYLNSKLKNKPDLLEADVLALKAGYNFGDTAEAFTTTYKVKPAELPPGKYRNIMGNEALVLGLITAAQKAGLPLFYGSYPITPASDILHGLSAHKEFGVRTFQAEDEIAAVGAAIGASFGGDLAITGTSGPGVALKTEAMGLALMLELPLVIINVQRGGPSTGLPTKTEQSDLLQAVYGRNGESPIPVVAAASPADCFQAAFEACRIALEHMTPVILLSDGYIANGAEPWLIPNPDDLPPIRLNVKTSPENGEIFMPYIRDERHVRPWAIPGTSGLAHRLGGLEKEANSGNVSYDPANHEYMVKIRAAKVDAVADFLPPLPVETGAEEGDLLILGWGSTYGVIKTVVNQLTQEGHRVGHIHLKHLKPFPKDLGEKLKKYERVVIPELNNGQLVRLIRDAYLIPAIPYNKIQGVPITRSELKHFVLELLNHQESNA
jgi:2-oxoglutarate ferredoxin oxidoreductase subunit alpha